jgi:hypothetical protein
MKNFFTAHPETVGETYWQHMAVALSFAGALFGAAFAALVHAFFPAWFEKTASAKITCLHDRMVCNRKNQTARKDAAFEVEMAENARQ